MRIWRSVLCVLLLSCLLVPSAAARSSRQVTDPFADRVAAFTPGHPFNTDLANPEAAIGAPDFNTSNLSGFVTLGVGGSLTLEFVNNEAFDGPGPDLLIHGDPDNDELIRVEVSLDGTQFISLGLVPETAELDLAPSGPAQVRFVRLIDDGSPVQGVSPGAEIDALEALHLQPSVGAASAPVPLVSPTSPLVAPAPVSPASPAQALPAADSLTWVRLGGPLGGLGYDIRMRPDNPDIMFVTDAWAGVHKSTDGGHTWFPANDGITSRQGESGDAIPVFCLTIDPNNNDVVWAGLQNLGELYRSTDGGTTWQKRVLGISERMGLTFRGITVQPGNSDVVYAAGEISPSAWAGRQLRGRSFDLTKGVLYKSTDGGQRWRSIWRGDNLARYLWIDPTNLDTLYLSTGIFDREAANSDPQTSTPGGVGVLKSTDGGKTWSQINEGLNSLYIGSLFMNPADPSVLLAGAGNNSYPEGNGVYLTTDGGAHWRQVLDTADVGVTSVEFSASDPNLAYAGGQHVFAVSADGGRTWERREHNPGRWGPLGIAPGFPIDFQVDPRSPQRLFTNNYGGGNFLTEDGGLTWISVSTGYTGADLRSLVVHPEQAAVVYTNGRSGPFKSYDAGKTWEGLNPENLSPIVEGSQISLQPGKPEHLILSESNRSMIYWSNDGGRTWSSSTNDWGDLIEREGPFIGGVEAVAFAPSQPEKVYAVFGNNFCKGFGEGCDSPEPASTVALSSDGGRSWKHMVGFPHDGLPGTAVVVHPEDSNRAWIAMPEVGILTTVDGGATWQETSGGLGTANPLSLAIDPAHPDTLYAGTWAQGVYKSTDGGASWRRSSSGMDPNEPIFTLMADPAHEEVVYAGSLRSGVYRSEDGGRRWIRLIDGLRMRSVHDLAISSDGMTLYAATRGEGVYRLDLAGSPPQAVTTPVPTASQPPTAAPTVLQQPSEAGASPGGLCKGTAILPVLFLGLAWVASTGRKRHHA
jgi:photosystem II stability/assembly factor-like uncharacterized protein